MRSAPPPNRYRCKATFVVRGHEIRCEADRGHTCAHYGEHMWWPNQTGMPKQQAKVRTRLASWWLVHAAIGLLVASAVVLWIVFHR